jgi:hypothetical protein
MFGSASKVVQGIEVHGWTSAARSITQRRRRRTMGAQHRGFAFATAFVLGIGSSFARAEPPVWERDFGSPLGLNDDSTYETTFGVQGFTFQYARADYSGNCPLSISSNGFVALCGSVGAGCCSPTAADFVTGTAPTRIAPLWTDLLPVPGTASEVYLNRFSDSGGPDTDRLVITWATQVYRTGRSVLVQLQLRSDGTIVFGYDGYDFTGGLNNVLVGITRGDLGGGDGPVDFSAQIPFENSDGWTFYEVFAGPNPAVDLDQTNIVFSPHGWGPGYVVTPDLCRPPIWESQLGGRFHNWGSDAPVVFTVDSFGDFSFPFGGTTYEGSSLLCMSPHGFVTFGGTSGSDCCDGDPTILTGGLFGRIAAFWSALDPEAPNGPGTYVNVFTSDPNGLHVDKLVFTWDTTLLDNHLPVLAQLQLHRDGSFSLGWECYYGAGLTHDILVGTSPGGGVPDPGSTDLSAAIPFSSGGEATIYEVFRENGASPPAFDLAGKNLVFEPDGQGGYHVDVVSSAAGTVNSGAGAAAIRDVLFVNGGSSAPGSRVVTIPQGQPFATSLSTAPRGPATNAGYALWVWPGSNFHPTELRSGSSRIGCLVNPTPLQAGRRPQPIACFHSPSLPATVCQGIPTSPSPSSAPWGVTRPGGFTHPVRFTLQGILRDDGAANALHFSTTNAVVIDVP